jgi:hypothetical protein
VRGRALLAGNRRPDCCVSTMNPVPMKVVFHFPKCIITIGIGEEVGFVAVPEARFIRDMPAGLISTIPACSDECSASWAHTALARIRSNPGNTNETNGWFINYKNFSTQNNQPIATVDSAAQ